MSHGFYRAFEDSFRGSRSSILNRLDVYNPFVAPLAKAYPNEETFDIGCGRGEWLEKMGELGFHATGVDLDEGMLSACHQLKLQAKSGDGIKHLKTLDAESQVVISAFHVVEHISFEEIETIFTEALRALKPGGILILETPNPENLIVATNNFYLDPSHLRPIPSDLLLFLGQFFGFERTKVLRLQESLDAFSRNTPSLLNVLGSASPDYAVVAQKTGHRKVLKLLDSAFDGDFGLTLESLAEKYDARLQNEVNASMSRACLAESSAVSAHQRLGEVAAEIGAHLAAISQATSHLESRTDQVEMRAAAAEEALHLVYNSRSWKITAPLRWVTFQMGLLREHGLEARLISLTGKTVGPLARATLKFVRSHPELEQILYSSATRLGLVGLFRQISTRIEANARPIESLSDPGVLELTEQGQRIFDHLMSQKGSNRA